jgi:hypothetical protein
MALTALDYFKPYRCLGGGTMPTLEVVKATATTWNKGDVIVGTTGLAVAATDEPAIETVLGVAVEAAVSGPLTGLIVPALPNITFWGRIATGDAGATADLAEAHRYVSGTAAGFEISYDTVPYINVGETTEAQVMIINFIDAIGTAWGAVEFVFTCSAFNAVT